MKCSFDLSVAVVFQEREGFIMWFLLGKRFWSTSQSVVIGVNLDGREMRATAAVVEYQQAAESMKLYLSKRSAL